MPLRSVLWLHFLRFRFSSVINPLSPVLFPGVLLVAAVITRCGLVRPPPPLNLKRPRLHLRVTLKHVQTVQLVAYLKHVRHKGCPLGGLPSFIVRTTCPSHRRHRCYACCQGFLPCLSLPFRSTHLHFFSKHLPIFSPCWLWLTPVPV